MIIHLGGSKQGYTDHSEDYMFLRSTLLAMGHKLGRDWLGKDKNKGLDSLMAENERSIMASDCVILDASYDAYSVGFQLALALTYQRPILLLCRDGLRSMAEESNLINKKDKKLIQSRTYSTPEEISQILTDFLDWTAKTSKMARFNIELDKKLDNYLKMKARINKSSKALEIRRLVQADLDQYLSDKD
jgi:hypothetical protein